MQDLKLQLKLMASGGNATVAEIRKVMEAEKQAKEEAAKEPRGKRTKGFLQELTELDQQIKRTTAASQAGADTTGQSWGVVGDKITRLADGYNEVTQALQSLVSVARPAYDLLIGANERLNAQLLSSQANLANATRISIGGNEITDPTAKIKATEATLRQALKRIEIDTQSLVGVTSSQVNELFQITLQNAAILANQSKQFPDSISAATSLTKGWAASLQVVGIPLFQARQEINSILKGQITQDSLLAKNLQLTNQQVEQWKSQGVLVDRLNAKLETYVAGNAIAARSISGISSNIQDLIERLGREAGAPLLDPIIDALAAIEKYLKDAEAKIQSFFTILVQEGMTTAEVIGGALGPSFQSLLKIAEDLGPIALEAFKGLMAVVEGLAVALSPVVNLLAKVLEVLVDFANTDLGRIVVQTAAMTLALSQLIPLVISLAATALPALWGAALSTATTLGTLVTSITAVATGNTALALSIPALQTAFAALTASALPLAAALLPLAQAIALTALVKNTAELESANDALEEYGRQYGDAADATIAYAQELKALDQIRQGGGTLTAEQISREKLLRTNMASTVEGMQAQIKGLKALKVANEDQDRTRQNSIAALESQIAYAQRATGGMVLQANALQVLGTRQEQYAKRLKELDTLINSEGNGDAGEFLKAAKEKVSAIQEGIKNRDLDVASARKQLEAILNNTKIDREAQTAAKDAIVSLYDQRIAKVKELIEVGTLGAQAAIAELEAIKGDAGLEASTRRKAAQQIVAIRKEQIAAEQALLTAQQAEIAAQQAQSRLGEAAADRAATELKRQEMAKRLEATQSAIDNATNDTEKDKLIAEQRQQFAEQEKLEAEFAERSRKRAVENYDERRNLIKAQRDFGVISQTEYNAKLLTNDQAQIELQIQQLSEKYAMLSKTDIDGREAIQAKIYELESKARANQKQYNAEQLKIATEYYDQELKTYEAAKATKLISEAEFATLQARNRLAQADEEIQMQQQQMQQLGRADIEGRNAIEARIAELRVKRIAALDALHQFELTQVQQQQAKLKNAIEQAQAERLILLQQALNRERITAEDAEQAKLDSQRASLQAELALAEQQERSLAALARNTRSPEAERAYQEQVRAAKLATAQLTLRLAEQEQQQINLTRQQAIKAIEDRSAANARASDRLLSSLKDEAAAREDNARRAELAGKRQTTALDQVIKLTEQQNSLLSAQANLRTALDGLENARGDQRSTRLNEAIALREKLDRGEFTSDQERIDAQRRLAQLTGSNTQSLSDLKQAKAKLEQDAEARKLTQLTRQQEIARQQLSIQQRQAELAAKRAEIEAQISQIKARQALQDAQALVNTERINAAKAVEAAKGDLAKAKQQAPGRERDRAVADAQARIDEANAEGRRRETAALTGVEVARQGVDLANQNVELAKSSTAQLAEINRLQDQTLAAQQQSALIQGETASSTERMAAAYRSALGSARALSATPPPTQLPQLPGAPNPQGAGSFGSAGDVVGAIQRLTDLIQSRDPRIEVPVNFQQLQGLEEFEQFLKVQRSAGRANL